MPLTVKQIADFTNYSKVYGAVDLKCDTLFTSLARSIYEGIDKISFNDELNLNRAWIRFVDQIKQDSSVYIARIDYSGGVHFYRYLAEKAPKNLEDLKQLISDYRLNNVRDTYIDIDDILSTKVKKIPENNLIFLINRPDNTIALLSINPDRYTATLIDKNSTVKYSIDADKLSRLTSMPLSAKYTGISTNRFIYVPTTDFCVYAIYSEAYALSKDREISEGACATNGVSGVAIAENNEHSDTSDLAIVSDTSSYSMESLSAESTTDADRANETTTATIASDITEEGVTKLVDKLSTEIIENRSDILERITRRIEEERKERARVYDVRQYNGEYTTKPLYGNYKTEYQPSSKKSKVVEPILDIAHNILTMTQRLLIIGETGIGKTELAYLLAHERTNEPIGKSIDGEPQHYNRICVVSARDGKSLVSDEKTGILDKFIKHIHDNNITEPCVLICNEVQASDMGYILGSNLWENLNYSDLISAKYSYIPSNLYFIFTGCKDRDFGIDSQVTQRINYIELENIGKTNIILHEALVQEYGNESLLNAVENLNDNEGYSVISLRKYIDIITTGKIDKINDDILSASGKTLREKVFNEVDKLSNE